MENEEMMAIRKEEHLHDYLMVHYGIELQQIESIAGIFKLQTKQGLFTLKRVREGDQSRWHWLCKYAQESDVDFLPIPLLTKRNSPYFDGFYGSYVLLPWIDAESVTLTHATEWRQISRLLAQFHISTTRFVPDAQLKTIRSEWMKAFQDLRVMEKAAEWTYHPSPMDQVWLQESSYILGLIENIFRYYENINGDRICYQSAEFGRICHNCLHQKNILRRTDGDYVLIDWNEIDVGLRIQDLRDWILYAYQRTNNEQIIHSILTGYLDITSMAEDELALLYILFLFPDSYVETLRGFYLKQALSLADGLRIFSHLKEKEKIKNQFIRNYPTYLEEWFKIKIPRIPWLTKR